MPIYCLFVRSTILCLAVLAIAAGWNQRQASAGDGPQSKSGASEAAEKERAASAPAERTTDPSESEAMVGVATVDVTPDYPVRLSGFGGRRTESEGVTQRIFVKALAIGDDPKTAAVLITMDNLGLPEWMTRDVGRRLHEKVGLDPARLTITFTHTHTAPMLRGAAATIFSAPIPKEHQEHIDKYTEQMTNALVEVATKALASRAKARLSWGVGAVRFAVNRRTGSRPVDHDLPVLVVRELAGKVRAIYTSYACHCVTFGHNQISGDWAGYAAAALEKEFSDATAMVSIGCGADSNPDSGVTNGDVAAATRQGNMICDEIKRLVAGPLQPIKGQVAVRSERVDLPLAELPPREFWEKRAAVADGHVSLHAKAQLARLDRGEKLRTAVSYPIQTWCFGDDLAMVFLAGEVVVDYSARLKSELVADRVWTTGYSNDFSFYIPSERILREGGYEGGDAFIYFDMPAKFAPGLEKRIIDEVHRQLPDTFNATHDPKRTGGTSPKSPARSQESMRVRPGMKVELVAAEPLVVDPVAIDFGADGKLWVAEMHDYPQGLDGNFKPGGRVKLLSDANGDGRFDSATTFLEGLPFPTDVKVWRKGVLVCAAPDVLYAEDTNADGKADVVKKLFTGFATHNFQARVNSLQYGLDNWVYASTGLFGGKIVSFSGKSIDLTSRDFRMKPDTGEIEPVTGQSQQGRARDDWDNWFGCDSGQFIRHYPVVDRYVRRNLQVSPPATAVGVADYPNSSRVFPIAPLVTFKLSGPPGNATAACGLGIYRDDLLGAGFHGNSFTCEPVNQVVHRLVLSQNGSTFSARRAEDEQASEFLASSDNWFRPVQAKTGPDGALWVVDMYRYVIEHPIWIPPEVVATLDVRAGDQMGRLYRIVPEGRAARPLVRLDKLETAALVATLDTPNGPTRDLVHQLLVWRGDRAAVAPLEKLAVESKTAQVRAQARCVLEGLESLSADVVLNGLRDADAGVRRHAIRLCESVKAADKSQVASALFTLAGDGDAMVRLQLAYTLGEMNDEKIGGALAKLLIDHPADAYLRAAALSSLRRADAGAFVKTVLAAKPTPTDLLESLASLDPCVGEFGNWSAFLEGVLDVADSRKGKPDATACYAVVGQLMETYQRQFSTKQQVFPSELENRLIAVVKRARQIANDDEAAVEDRVRSVGIIGVLSGDRESDLKHLSHLLHPRHAVELQQAALAQLARTGDAAIVDVLLAERETYSPTLRRAVFDVLLSRPAWAKRLIDEIEEQRIRLDELDANQRERLVQAGDDEQKARAARLLAAGVMGTRQDVVKQYATVTTLHGDRNQGREVFAKRCAGCHRLDGMGHNVGPDLAPFAQKPPQALLLAILDPNQAVDPRFVSYSARTQDGQALSGMLTSESAASITLAGQDGKQQVLLRADIDELKSTGKSLMPEGLERDIEPEQMADLLAFLASAATPPKSFAGVVPRTVEPDASGELVLRATECEIRGPALVYESELKNLGYWHSEEDSAAWSVKLPTEEAFDVELDFACAEGSQGNQFALTVSGGSEGGGSLSGVVPATGGWNRYRTLHAGTLKLGPGEHRVVLRGEAPVRNALFDLRAVRFLPTKQRANRQAKAASAVLTEEAKALAATILDAKATSAEREAAMVKAEQQPAAAIAALAVGLPVEGVSAAEAQQEEYRRIPLIWRIAISAGRRNDAEQLRAIIAVSLPKDGEPLRDWQSVVLGGGVINGLTQAGVWPRARIAELLKDQPEQAALWDRSLELAAKMTDDKAVPHGTRYDALRMLGVDTWPKRGEQIVRYVAKGTNDELQMGAVSALGDMPEAEATAALLDHFEGFSAGNRKLAIEALFRSSERIAAMLEQLEAKSIPADALTKDQVEQIKTHDDVAVRDRAAKLFAE